MRERTGAKQMRYSDPFIAGLVVTVLAEDYPPQSLLY
ncbi:protein of unknown function (plasmid) [Cupriavidus taiwanensis]|uniref:Uncharacterized protein n=1 Tax=Cupriavidus taiwanensis TaxID=164546 RepID=A0A375ISX6_9BURK|nr:protein of unknown function [Cupriavidus taiwanensis]